MNPKGKIITLRAIEKNDLIDLQRWSNDQEIQYWLGGWHFPTSMDTMEKWLDRINSDNLNQRFAIDHVDLGLVGTTNLVEINWKDRNAFHGMLIGDKDIRGKGIGVDVVFTIMRYAFEELGLQ
ncbi:MAG TPA: GNAT family N-acetyltransferase [Bacteroidales bacterium]|nr:GNAT family N-acetyltransferase [Bacteroidales bacterium]HPM91244.1 GNAT family N-acetyltransferase [Bacteroidales bacterium]